MEVPLRLTEPDFTKMKPALSWEAVLMPKDSNASSLILPNCGSAATIFSYLFLFESGVGGQELLEAIDDEDESVLPTFSFTDIRLWEARTDGGPSGTVGTSDISKDTADQNEEERITF